VPSASFVAIVARSRSSFTYSKGADERGPFSLRLPAFVNEAGIIKYIRMSLDVVVILFQAVVFLFAISAHEAAHAYVAWRCGDPTAKMLGRVSLNPLRHIDIFGTLIMPVICIFMGAPIFGWAKPTPVNTRNFGNKIVRNDVLTSLAGPASNLLIATLAVLVLVVIGVTSQHGRDVVGIMMQGMSANTGSPIEPLALLCYQAMFINLLLAVFNVIPVPPLDGSHVIRHFLSPQALRIYDYVGMFGIVIIWVIGRPIIGFMMAPFMAAFQYVLAKAIF